MSLFKHTGHGHFLGCVIIVEADDRETAGTLVRKELAACGLPTEKVSILPLVQVCNTVIYTDDGDY